MTASHLPPHELQAVCEALSDAQAIVWFTPDGTLLEVNDVYCRMLGYQRDEIVGKSYQMLVRKDFAEGPDYRDFWHRVGRGEFTTGEFECIAKDGSEVYIDGFFRAIRDESGSISKILKIANDKTDRKKRRVDLEKQFDAVARSLAIIEFDLGGNILSANENFLKATGYSLDEITGRHHRIFVDPDYARTEEYNLFWRELAGGKLFSAEYPRIAKDGNTFWIQATYNPIVGTDGKPTRIMKFATDITNQKEKSLKLIDGITEIGASITREAEVITSTYEKLSERSETQASTVEQTSAAMEQISTTVKSNVENAERATEEARSARQQAEKGSEVVEQAIAAMEKIEDGSKQVRKFIEVIDSIAFQTNLLALNAGVEAARAGDAGRGFAVVASEVRALAQRASESAKDINALIDSNGREVSEGAALVKETGSVLKVITEGVTQVSEGIESICEASREQASGLSEIYQAVSEIDKATHENAAMAQESTHTAATLVRNAVELQGLLGQGAKKRETSSRERGAPAPASTLSPPVPAPPRKLTINAGVLATDDAEDWTEF